MQDTIIGMRVLTQYECLSTKINSREEARNGTRALNRNHYGIQRIKSLSLLYIYISRYFVEFKCGNLSILDWKVLQRCRYIV